MFIRYNTFGILWAFLILVLAMMPGSSAAPKYFLGLVPFDKFLHFLMYLILVFLLANGFLKQHSFRKLNYYPLVSALIIASLYGMILEVLQEALTYDRSFELADILANFTGCLAGSALFTLIYLKL